MDFLRFPALALLAAAAAMCGAAAAAEATPREHLLNFSASARLEVEQDLLGITLAVTREGSNAAAVQAQLKQVLDAALSETRPAAKAGAMEVRTGNFSLYPRHDKNGRIDGWQGRAELVLEGKDTERVAA
ncbi:MAG: SIMPL domain-containing protein, partial [Methylibium sp.]|nr:SIMPL domain-containing protein [Methylibium sp.]